MSFLKEEYPELMWDGEEKLPIVVSFGAGVDSTAILVGLHHRSIRPDLIVFSDTGAERPDIYAHIEKVNKWLASVGFPLVQRVTEMQEGKEFTLENHLIKYNDMPSLVYGFKSCSVAYKIKPVNRFIKAQGIDRHIHVIGYGVGEIDRAIKAVESSKKIMDKKKKQSTKDKMRRLWFPLIDWKLNRDECKALSSKVGFCTSKSSCYFCPSTSKSGVIKLQKTYPELYEKAIEIEAKAMKQNKERYKNDVYGAIEAFGKEWFTISKEVFESRGVRYPSKQSVYGLGRNWNWKDVVDSASPELPFMDEFGVDMGCGCTDF
jgi:hypothetical protein